MTSASLSGLSSGLSGNLGVSVQGSRRALIHQSLQWGLSVFPAISLQPKRGSGGTEGRLPPSGNPLDATSSVRRLIRRYIHPLNGCTLGQTLEKPPRRITFWLDDDPKPALHPVEPGGIAGHAVLQCCTACRSGDAARARPFLMVGLNRRGLQSAVNRALGDAGSDSINLLDNALGIIFTSCPTAPAPVRADPAVSCPAAETPAGG